MALIPMAPPIAVPLAGGFDYVTVDAAHRRVYAAHTGAQALLIVDADTGKVRGQIHVGPMHGVAYSPDGARAYTGDGTADTVSEVDPATLAVLRSASLPGPIDAIALDAADGNLYADEDDGTRMFVIDAKAMKPIATVALPGHKPEYLAIDPHTHLVYQNIADRAEIAVVDPVRFAVTSTIATPELQGNHPLQYDAGFHEIVVGGANGVLSVYDTTGRRRFQTTMPSHIDQCDLDPGAHVLACAGGTAITLFALRPDAAPKQIAQYTGRLHVHTVAIDAKTHDVWGAFVDERGSAQSFVQRFAVAK